VGPGARRALSREQDAVTATRRFALLEILTGRWRQRALWSKALWWPIMRCQPSWIASIPGWRLGLAWLADDGLDGGTSCEDSG
jgi:hypothetical protein